MDDNDSGKLVQLSTYVRDNEQLHEALMTEKRETGLSVSAILRLALTEHCRHRKQFEREET